MHLRFHCFLAEPQQMPEHDCTELFVHQLKGAAIVHPDLETDCLYHVALSGTFHWKEKKKKFSIFSPFFFFFLGVRMKILKGFFAVWLIDYSVVVFRKAILIKEFEMWLFNSKWPYKTNLILCGNIKKILVQKQNWITQYTR